MIQFTLNNQNISLDKEITIFDYLDREGLLKKWVAIIVNEEPISIDESKTITVKDRMKIDIVHFVGGG